MGNTFGKKIAWEHDLQVIRNLRRNTGKNDISKWVNLKSCPLNSIDFAEQCRQKLSDTDVLLLHQFLLPEALNQIIKEAQARAHLAYFTKNTHNVYLSEPDTSLPKTHIFNRQVKSSKGCITTDQIRSESGLHVIYNNSIFKKFIAHVVQENAIYPYADPLSGINIHYANEGEELGWHFDNSSFAITLLLQAPKDGGVFQYVSNMRNINSDKMNFDEVEAVLNDKAPVKTLHMEEGTLVLFRGLNSLHRVTPTIGNRTRILVVLAYNNKADVSLSETARMTFFGRLS